MFDWQAKMSSLAIAPKVARVIPPPAPTVLLSVSFAQALTASTKMAPNANLPKPIIIGETLRRGYYKFLFASEMDKCNVWAAGTVTLKSGVLRLFEWSKDFNMLTQRNPYTQVWIRLLELPHEYWMEQTLREIASAVGTPLVIDNSSSKRLFGHYARILVDMDFSRKIFHEIVVEREGYAFPIFVAYKWMPDFCSHFLPTPMVAPLEEETEIVPHPQHQSMNSDIPVRKTLEAASLEATLELGAASLSHGDEIINHTDDIPVEIQTTIVTPISHSPAINDNTFSIQLENVSDDIVRNDLKENEEHILSPIKEKNIRY
ncbi:DUF4283 domain protein [Medicago truncatula]|uniref:DUF4283 domain protein n=1 Tax=Medicago truncatula TaxID=3880 RepID=A0A072VHW8_MEDTR|nr:DUF4283 domain protein [Medicago truncatula]